MATQVIEILSAEEIRRTLTRLASQLIEKSGDLSELVLLGIYTRGVPLAHLIAQQVEMLEQIKVPVGAIDESSSTTLNAVGRHHPGQKNAKGGSANFGFVDGHVEQSTITDTVTKRRWGDKFWSLNGLGTNVDLNHQ